MRESALLQLLLLALFSAGTNAQNCSVAPVILPFKNVTVLTYPNVGSPYKALPVQFGEERSQLAVGFGTNLNGSFVPDSGSLCEQGIETSKGCTFWRGGLFNLKDSATFVKDAGTVPNINGSSSNEGYDYLHKDEYQSEGEDPLSKFPRGWDKIAFADSTIDYYPFSIINNASFPFSVGVLGMASASNFLKAAVNTSTIPSRSFGFEAGQNALGKETEGQLVLGGYNTERTSPKDWKNFTIFPDKSKPCPLQVTINRVSMGSSLRVTTPFMACVEPAYHTMILPQSIQRQWNKTIQGAGRNTFWKSTWEYIYFNTSDGFEFPGDDLEMEIEGGLSVKIPSEELWRHGFMVNETRGGWDPIPPYVNSSYQNVIQTYIGHAGFVDKEPLLSFLGGPFLSQLYLTVDYEANRFSLTPLKSRTPKASARVPKTATLGCSELVKPKSVPSPAPTKEATKASGSNKGRIIGGAVGGVVGLLAIAALGLFCFFRRRGATQPPSAFAADQSTEAHKGPENNDLPSPVPISYPGPVQGQYSPPGTYLSNAQQVQYSQWPQYTTSQPVEADPYANAPVELTSDTEHDYSSVRSPTLVSGMDGRSSVGGAPGMTQLPQTAEWSGAEKEAGGRLSI